MEQSTLTIDSTNRGRQTDQLSEAVVDAVAAAEDADPTDLTPLYTAIDPDALEALFQSRLPGPNGRAGGEIRFSYHGYVVRVSSSGEVALVGGNDQ